MENDKRNRCRTAQILWLMLPSGWSPFGSIVDDGDDDGGDNGVAAISEL